MNRKTELLKEIAEEKRSLETFTNVSMERIGQLEEKLAQAGTNFIPVTDHTHKEQGYYLDYRLAPRESNVWQEEEQAVGNCFTNEEYAYMIGKKISFELNLLRYKEENDDVVNWSDKDQPRYVVTMDDKDNLDIASVDWDAIFVMSGVIYFTDPVTLRAHLARYRTEWIKYIKICRELG